MAAVRELRDDGRGGGDDEDYEAAKKAYDEGLAELKNLISETDF